MNYDFVKLYKHCQFKWYLKYGLEVESEDLYSPVRNDLLKQLVMDMIIFDEKTAIDNYYNNYPIIENKNVEEVIKASHMYNRVKDILPPGIKEYNYKEVDILVKNRNGKYDLYDVQYEKEYIVSNKLSILKYNIDKEVENLKVLFIPKLESHIFKNEDVSEYRARLRFHLDFFRPEIKEVEYNQDSVNKYIQSIKDIENNDGTELNKNIGFHCYSCEYENICKRSR